MNKLYKLDNEALSEYIKQNAEELARTANYEVTVEKDMQNIDGDFYVEPTLNIDVSFKTSIDYLKPTNMITESGKIYADPSRTVKWYEKADSPSQEPIVLKLNNFKIRTTTRGQYKINPNDVPFELKDNISWHEDKPVITATTQDGKEINIIVTQILFYNDVVYPDGPKDD